MLVLIKIKTVPISDLNGSANLEVCEMPSLGNPARAKAVGRELSEGCLWVSTFCSLIVPLE